MTRHSLVSWKTTRVTKKLGIDLPIVQGALGGFSTQKLTAAVSNYGGLGSFGALNLSPEAIRDAIDEIRSLTQKSFAVNLWVSKEDEGAFTSTEQDFERSLSRLAPHIRAFGGTPPAYSPYRPIRFEDQMRVLIDAKVPVFSFIYGIPPAELLDECRRLGIAIIGTATTVAEAKALADAGVDMVVASGFEAGGHRGSFLKPAEDSLTGTMSLVPQAVDAIDLPVIAAGGIADARGAVAAFALGAEAIQMGTFFLATVESGASELHRQAILNCRTTVTGLTRGFTGRLARGIKNRLMDEMNRPDAVILPYPLQRSVVGSLSNAALKAGQGRYMQMWSGQSASLVRSSQVVPALDLLVEEISGIAERVAGWGRESVERL
ncbi:MAG TPA: nitronate monooxygenase [Terracidiphilus sp.]|nr:nitronate monooxygenase [Terracidiphilus sp.]